MASLCGHFSEKSAKVLVTGQASSDCGDFLSCWFLFWWSFPEWHEPDCQQCKDPTQWNAEWTMSPLYKTGEWFGKSSAVTQRNSGQPTGPRGRLCYKFTHSLSVTHTGTCSDFFAYVSKGQKRQILRGPFGLDWALKISGAIQRRKCRNDLN